MHYIRTGHGTPPVVFVHGFACDHTDWRRQIDAFGASREVIACDLRGHGGTPGTAAECSIERFGADVAALIETRQLAAPILVGHSMGCRVVLEAARSCPDRIAGLVLIDGSRLGSGDPDRAAADARAAMADPRFIESFFAGMFLRQDAESAAIVERAARMSPELRMSVFASLARWDASRMEEALAQVRAPLLTIQTTHTDPQRRRVSLQTGQTTPWLDLVRSHVPAAQIDVLSGLGHFPQLEAADKVNRMLTEFVSKQEASGLH